MQSLAVYCGSSPGDDPVYRESARALGGILAELGLRLVYGGGSVGLMGVVADAVLAAGGEVVGVITEHLRDKELGHGGLTDLHVVATMHERKALMADLADGFCAMPGSIGTLEEIAEVMVWTQLGLQSKPCGLLNVDGYYDDLIAMVDKMVEERFLHAQHRDALIVEAEPAAMVERLTTAEVQYHDKWLHGEERR